jgi:hypothetical protein
MTTGYGWHRRPFWPWHYVQHVLRGIRNGYFQVPYGTGESGSAWAAPRLFCTYCVDDRCRAFNARTEP